jgi:excisionase family DNA binding protein
MLHIATLCNNKQQTATSMSSNMSIEKVCDFCQCKYIAKKTTTHYCTLKCASRAYKKRAREEKIVKSIETENNKRPYNPVVKEKEFLSINEVCMLLGASRWTIYRLVESGKIKAAKLGRKTLIQRLEIDNLFK